MGVRSGRREGFVGYRFPVSRGSVGGRAVVDGCTVHVHGAVRYQDRATGDLQMNNTMILHDAFAAYGLMLPYLIILMFFVVAWLFLGKSRGTGPI